MKLFFLMRNSIYLRNYESVVRLLADRGHDVLLGFAKIDRVYSETEIARLVKEHPGINYVIFPQRDWFWKRPATFIRVLQTYLRFLDDRYKDAPKLRARADSLLSRPIRWIVKKIVGQDASKRWSCIHFLQRIERAIPLDPRILDFFKGHQPDVFLITPLIDLQAKQLDWLKCSKSLGIISTLCVASWDNLTNKSLIQVEPDAVFVWNNIQQKEALELHHIPPSKIVITGAQCYDRLFAHRPSASREEFLRKAGFNEQGDYILYLCSSKFIAPHEVDFISRWIMRLRSSQNSELNRLGVLIRPHPQNSAQWRDVDFSGHGDVAVFPRNGANPIRGNPFDDYYDSIYYSIATVGINTSAMIESGILNKPVFTILSAEFRSTQNGTLHFRHLVEGGLLNISAGLEEHIEQLSQVLARREAAQKRINHFIRNFVRPHGLETECTTIFAKAVEDLGRGTDARG